MFIINLNYTASPEELESHMQAHISYLDKYYKKNIFIASGPKVPPAGSIILAVANSQDIIEKIITEDPFYQLQLAKFTITEFSTSQSHPALKELF